MKKLLETRLGKEIDVHCEGAVIRGTAVKIEDNVLFLEKDDAVCYINIDRIAAVWDSREKKSNPPGFIAAPKEK